MNNGAAALFHARAIVLQQEGGTDALAASLRSVRRNAIGSHAFCVFTASRYVSALLGEEMTENEELTREIGLLADRAESNPETGVDIKALAVGLWASFNEFSIEEIEDALRDAWRTRGLAFNDNAGD
ncbi:hypothetical protein ACFYE8_32980 [Rhizobium leguminosarum]|uniref:hypothetical protein n=1 Tax=Rhizobium leguminosarum TaxID=384 RepID=UPI0036DEEED3